MYYTRMYKNTYYISKYQWQIFVSAITFVFALQQKCQPADKCSQAGHEDYADPT